MATNFMPDRAARSRSQLNCDRGAAMGRVFRCARVLVAGMEQLDRGLYRVESGDLLALRTALAEAARIVRNDERSST
jgi:hypothetical protein